VLRTIEASIIPQHNTKRQRGEPVQYGGLILWKRGEGGAQVSQGYLDEAWAALPEFRNGAVHRDDRKRGRGGVVIDDVAAVRLAAAAAGVGARGS
jgi:hypothetical protein